MVLQIISGGQTGVDRAALDVAIALDIPHRGWCPRGRLAEDGPIDRCYQLKETAERDYSVRTEKNVVESDGTLIFFQEGLTGGTRLTYQLARRHRRPHLTVDLDSDFPIERLDEWLMEHQIQHLNVAGPRESTRPGIYDQVFFLLKSWLEPQQNI